MNPLTREGKRPNISYELTVSILITKSSGSARVKSTIYNGTIYQRTFKDLLPALQINATRQNGLSDKPAFRSN
jgi:hypothetical protein